MVKPLARIFITLVQMYFYLWTIVYNNNNNNHLHLRSDTKLQREEMINISF